MFRFPWGDFHSLNLGWFLQKFDELRQDWATAEGGIDGALDAEIQKAEDALTDVFAARDAAAASASAANSSALNASQSSLASMDARDQSRAARDAAQQAAGNAAASETAAGNSATAASNSAGAAATSATQAANSATAAGQQATNAAGSATAAAGSASDAANSATAAAASAAAAEAVEESIPEDYSTLSAEVTTIKNNIADGKLPFAMIEQRFKTLINARNTGSFSGRTIIVFKERIFVNRTGSGSTYRIVSLFSNYTVNGQITAAVLKNLFTSGAYIDISDPNTNAGSIFRTSYCKPCLKTFGIYNENYTGSNHQFRWIIATYNESEDVITWKQSPIIYGGATAYVFPDDLRSAINANGNIFIGFYLLSGGYNNVQQSFYYDYDILPIDPSVAALSLT